MTLADPADDRLRRAFAGLAESAVPRDDCPDPGRLWAASRGELSPEEVLGLVEHTAGCGACAEAWRLARDLGPVRPGSVAARLEAPRRAWWGSWMSLAAAAMVAGVAVSTVSLLGPRGTPGYRAGGAPAIRSLIPESRPLPRERFHLRWTAGPEGSRYDVRVATPDLTTLAVARGLETPEWFVPPNALAALPSGALLLWQVEVVPPDGNRASSPTFYARLE